MKKWIAAFSFLFAAQGCFAQVAADNKARKIDSLLHAVYPDSLPGISIAVMQNHYVVLEKSYGIRKMGANPKITFYTNFNIASLTKQFTAMAILQLAEQHKLSLNDKLSRFFPGMNKKTADSICVQQLLTHTSGIRDHYEYANAAALKHAHDSDVYNAMKNVDSLYFKPGSEFRYSNTGYCLLALIIEQVSGLSYSQYMKKCIFLPAGMKGTTIWSETATILVPATGYDRDSVTNRFLSSGANEHVFFSTEGDGGIYTSVHDYLLWLKALNGTGIFSRKITDEARSLQFAIHPEQKLGYGFGWFVDESAADKKVYHSGDNGGFRTYSFTIPNQGLAIVVFSNRSDVSVEDLVEKIYRILYPDDSSFTKIEVLTS